MLVQQSNEPDPSLVHWSSLIGRPYLQQFHQISPVLAAFFAPIRSKARRYLSWAANTAFIAASVGPSLQCHAASFTRRRASRAGFTRCSASARLLTASRQEN